MPKIKGKIVEILAPVNGENSKSEKWEIQKMIVQTVDDNEMICIELTPAIIEKENYQKGQEIELDVRIRSFNNAGKWFTTVEKSYLIDSIEI